MDEAEWGAGQGGQHQWTGINIKPGSVATAAGLAVLAAAKGVARQSIAPATLRAYRANWMNFSTWCASVGLTPIPAAPITLPAYLVTPCGQVHAALRRLQSLLAMHPEGEELAQFLPPLPTPTAKPTLHFRAALASTFLARLELTKQKDFGDIQLQSAD